MTRKDLERRLHAAVSALADLSRDDGINVPVADIGFSGVAEMVDIVAALGSVEPCRCVGSGELEGREVEFSVAKAIVLGVTVRAYGKWHPVDIATSPTDPAPASVPKTLAGGILSDRKGAV